MSFQSVLPPRGVAPTPWEKQGKSYQKWKADIDKQKAIDEYWANKRARGGGGGGLSGGGEGSAALEESQAEANRIAEEQLKIAQRQQEIAEERYRWWKENYQPFEKDFIQRAKMGEDIRYAADRAGNQQMLQQQAAKESYGREMQRMGIDANDPRYSQLMGSWDLYKQAAIAGARNIARTQAAEKTRQMRAQVAGMGTGLSPQSVSVYGGAAQSMTGGAESKAMGASGVAGAYNTGMKARLAAEQFASDLAARQGSLSLGQQELAAKRSLFDQEMASKQRQYQWGQQGQMYGAIGQLAGLGLGAGLGYMMTPSAGGASVLGGSGAAGIGATALGTVGGQSANYGGASGSGSYWNMFTPLLMSGGSGGLGNVGTGASMTYGRRW